jgi:uncharacterized phage-like protein YoqJ
MKAFFTGHRDTYHNSTSGVEKLIDLAIKKGVSHFYCGMALGYDQMFARILIEKHLKWTAVIPFLGQEKIWKKSQQKEYRNLLRFSTKRIILAREYSPEVFHVRNEYMIKHSNLCLAVYSEREFGGTYETLKKTEGKMPILMLNPIEKKIILKKVPEQLTLF